MFCEADYRLNILTNEDAAQVVLYISNTCLSDEAQNVYRQVCRMSDVKFDFCELLVKDWDSWLTPWSADAGMKDRKFAGKGRELLDDIREKILPEIKHHFPNHRQLYIAGYSLAGLFSLWALYESGLFDGAVSCSGSLWYPGVEEYLQQTELNQNADVYLSLGKKEPKTANHLMKRVGEITEAEYEKLRSDINVGNVIFEWNDGGHFANVVERMAMGIRWIIS